jgi:hypothetical protein
MRNGSPDGRALWWVGLLLVLSVVLGGALRPPKVPVVDSNEAVMSLVEPARGIMPMGGTIRLRSAQGGALYVSDPADGKGHWYDEQAMLEAVPDLRATARRIATPTALQWRHPLPGLPAAMVFQVAERLPDGRVGLPVQHTYLFADHGALPVISMTASDAAFFDADRGLLVVGNGIFTADTKVTDYHANDPRWWKYPGNFHGRGKEWQRPGTMELMDPQGREILQAPVDLRINGQMTRGFPQHALRVLLREPLEKGIFPDGDGEGIQALVLRAAGNDQVKAMLRDAYQHGLCRELPFETSRSLTCVTYLNGAYWGVHHLRQRMDEKELARRHGISPKDIALLEDRAFPYHADSYDVRAFLKLVKGSQRWDGRSAAWLDTVEARLDVDGFLTYMASQMILGNMDWPRQNVKYWRYNGEPTGQSPLDGRWRFIMGDSDLSFGANAPVTVELFAQVKLDNAPISSLFMALMRSPVLKARFVEKASALLAGPLSAKECVQQLDSLVGLMAPEMDRHTARWRKPLDRSAWKREVDVMRTFAAGREKACREQLGKLRSP